MGRVSLFYSRMQAEELRQQLGGEASGFTEALVPHHEAGLELTRYTHQGSEAPAYEDAYVVAEDVEIEDIQVIRDSSGKYTREGRHLRKFLAQEGFDLEADDLSR